MASIGVRPSAHHPHPASDTYRRTTGKGLRSESSISRLIMRESPLRAAAVDLMVRPPDGAVNGPAAAAARHTRTVAVLDQKDREEKMGVGRLRAVRIGVA
jgi:hypothetical protein